MTVTEYTDGVGNLVGVISEKGVAAGAVVVPEWCGMTVREAVESFVSGDGVPGLSLVGELGVRALEPKLRPEGTSFEM